MSFIQIYNYEEICSWSANYRTLLIIILGPDAILVIKISALVQHVEDEGLFHKITFESYALFRVKFACAVDIILETFLTKCVNR